jgi:FdhD protein
MVDQRQSFGANEAPPKENDHLRAGAATPHLPDAAPGSGSDAPDAPDGSPAPRLVVPPRAAHKAAPLPVVRAPAGRAGDDLVAVEEPLEIRIAGETVAVIMRSPGDDHLLALGYLFGEGILRDASDATAVFHCGRLGDEGYGNTIDVAPASGARIDWARIDVSRRGGVTSSACGVCGRVAVEDLLAGVAPMPLGEPIPVEAISRAVEALRRHQPAWDATGGTHGAALWDRAGVLIAAHEDVGRHNAVDKVVGGLLLARAAGGRPEPAVLAVSGRGGFEIVQKAARAGIPVLACVSAPTTLAVEVARAANVTLCGFVRGERVNVYAAAERLAGMG